MRWRLLFFGYPLLEISAAWAVAQLLGWGWTLLLLIAGIPIGFYVMRRAGSAAFSSVRQVANNGGLPPGEAGSHSLTFIAGLLIAIPGFCTDLLGLMLLMPPIKELVRRRVAQRIFASGFPNPVTFSASPDTPPNFGDGDVVIGEVVGNDENTRADRRDPKQTGPSLEGPV
ncbi:MAG: hypothetical protein CK552_01505 [Actinobacteria bacterium]|nr:MAG: hypothetical protein CK552_01505 [Actinomycetota bacterium]